ncbi:MAG: hypothetical protein ACREJU_13235 [Nitrospiraceae bacterium]
MNRRLRQSIAVGLAVCLLLLSGLVYSQTVPHAAHHAHHKAATHTTALCSWMCAAGQGLEAIPFVLYAQLQPLIIVDLASSEDLQGIVRLPSHSRAPPLSLV